MLIRPVAQRAARMPVTIIIFSYMVWFLALSERQPFTNNRMIWRLQVDSHFKFGRCSFAQLGGLGTPAKRSLSSVQANRQRTCRLHTRCTTRVLPLAGRIGFFCARAWSIQDASLSTCGRSGRFARLSRLPTHSRNCLVRAASKRL